MAVPYRPIISCSTAAPITMLQTTQDIRKVARCGSGHADIRTTEIMQVDPSEKLEAMEAVLPTCLASRAIQGA